MSAADKSAIALVRGLRHRVGNRHACRCEECRALVRTTTLASEAVAMKESRRNGKRKPATSSVARLSENAKLGAR